MLWYCRHLFIIQTAEDTCLSVVLVDLHSSISFKQRWFSDKKGNRYNLLLGAARFVALVDAARAFSHSQPGKLTFVVFRFGLVVAVGWLKGFILLAPWHKCLKCVRAVDVYINWKQCKPSSILLLCGPGRVGRRGGGPWHSWPSDRLLLSARDWITCLSFSLIFYSRLSQPIWILKGKL